MNAFMVLKEYIIISQETHLFTNSLWNVVVLVHEYI